ncbi:hypothetical protein F5887DRAFT_979987 [Amanita rubescens]|nr:hypothetical protein F5887DRAFT_979987 [Amanita rubescens]
MRFSFIAILFIVISAAFALPVSSDDSSRATTESLFKALPKDMLDKRIKDFKIQADYRDEYTWAQKRKGYIIEHVSGLSGSEELEKVGEFCNDLRKLFEGPAIKRLIGWWKGGSDGYIVYRLHEPIEMEKEGLRPGQVTYGAARKAGSA